MTDRKSRTCTLRGLHAGQVEVYTDAARFKVLVAGRRWGKTRLGVAAALQRMLEGGRVWWVSPNYPQAAAAWRELQHFARKYHGVRVHETDRSLRSGRGWLRVKSAGHPDSLRGEGLDLVVLDEAAIVPEAAWSEALRPALADRLGHALFLSTPKGHNWFWRLFQSAADEGWARWRFPSSANPHFQPAELEAARLKTPDRIFRQEYLAEFIEDSGGVFRRVQEAATAQPQERAAENHEYVFGVDWGRVVDFTAVAVVDATTRELVALDRFNKVDYAVQTGRLKALAERFNPRCIVAEQNSMGDPLVEQLARDGLPMQPFLTSAPSKARVIEGLALAFERGALRILNDPVLVGELLALEAERLPSGLSRYAAPEGMHDDCVIALALAWSGAAESSSGSGIGFL